MRDICLKLTIKTPFQSDIFIVEVEQVSHMWEYMHSNWLSLKFSLRPFDKFVQAFFLLLIILFQYECLL